MQTQQNNLPDKLTKVTTTPTPTLNKEKVINDIISMKTGHGFYDIHNSHLKSNRSAMSLLRRTQSSQLKVVRKNV